MTGKNLVAEGATYVFRLSPLARRVIFEALTYLAPRKLHRLEEAVRQVKRESVPGDVLEFGVALGGSAIVLAHHLQGTGRKFIGFDVFTQIPPPDSEHDDDKSRNRYGIISAGQSRGIRGRRYYGYEDDLIGKVSSAFARHGVEVNGDEIRLEVGLFQDSLPKHSDLKVALAHLDCDWYSPVMYCLEYLADRMSPGGLIVLDDYHDYGGCRSAVDQFLAARQDFVFEDGPNPLLRRNLVP